MCGVTLALGCILGASCVRADINIPNLGTAGALGISVQREEAIGEFFMRSARSQLEVVHDPVLSEYVTTIGNRLVSCADNVLFDFDFFLVRNDTLNASAFLGGKVAINTGLFRYAKTEDQFASVLAHEITHVTQRHIARYVESITRSNNLSFAGVIGALVLGILNPAVGMAAMSTSLGAMAQAGINYTRENEYEADRIGITLLYNAGFNPQATVELFKTLMEQQGNVNPAFTMLLDHPLSSERVAEAQNRVAHLGRRQNSTNPDYDFAKARILVRHSPNQDYKQIKDSLLVNAERQSDNYVNYGLALACYELDQLEEASQYLERLGSKFEHNLFVLDLKTDIDLKAKRYNNAISRLNTEYKRIPNNQVVVTNLANAYLESSQYSKGQKLLESYTRNRPEDIVALGLLEKIYERQNNKCDALQTRGEIYALSAGYSYALGLYNQALQACQNPLTKERIKARVSQIVVQRSFDEELLRN